MKRFLVIVAFILAACGGQNSAPAPGGPVVTLALVNGRVWTGSSAQPSAEAIAIVRRRTSACARQER